MSRHGRVPPAWAWAAAVAHLVLSGGASRLRIRTAAAESWFGYDYSRHGQDWVQGACASRSRQSPIDIPALFAYSYPSAKLSYKYQNVDQPFVIYNNGHAYSADFAGMGYGGVTYEGAWYALMNINVHALGEHTYAGARPPLELHMVHKRYDGDALLIVAIPFNYTGPSLDGSIGTPPVPYAAPSRHDPGSNPVLQAFVRQPLPPVNMKTPVPFDPTEALDFNLLLAGGTYFEYFGSTTAPPCTENVVWMLRREILWMSHAQAKILHNSIYTTTADFGNYREAMPLNGRSIQVRIAIQEEPLPPPPLVKASEALPRPHTDRELAAMRWAKDSLRIATASMDYVKDVDRRLRAGAEAHLRALQPAAFAPMLPPTTTTPCATCLGGAAGPEAQAMAMAASISNAAKQAVVDASQQIQSQATQSAVKAAQEAVKEVLETAPAYLPFHHNGDFATTPLPTLPATTTAPPTNIPWVPPTR